MKILRLIKNKILEILRIRLVFMTIIALVLFGILSIRMYKLQIFEGEDGNKGLIPEKNEYRAEKMRYTGPAACETNVCIFSIGKLRKKCRC